jgi:hypothetical protein
VAVQCAFAFPSCRLGKKLAGEKPQIEVKGTQRRHPALEAKTAGRRYLAPKKRK